jgi:hypothetical protein
LVISVQLVSVDTGSWTDLQSPLRFVADYWTAPDSEGISRIAMTHVQRVAIVTMLIGVPHFHDLESFPRIDDHGRVHEGRRAKNLAAFMVGSALANINADMPMRRCDRCRDWYGIARAGQRFCSPSCRSLTNAPKTKGKK